MVDADSPLASLTESRAWGARLLGGPVIYFPIRHHSPACAWHLEQLIEHRRPELVLIEGPSDLDGFIELLRDPGTVPPIALYSHCNLRASEDGRQSSPGGALGRHGAYYPLSACSPEWIALQTAGRLGAEVRFIDLTFPAQTLVDHSNRLSDRVATLLAEHWFRRSAWLRRLAASLGCRDVDECWDRLFESWAREQPTERFVSDVATYCALARRDVTDEEHRREGTTAREAEMAWHIAQALRNRGNGTIVVVTGGYHSIALPDLVARGPERPSIDQGSVASAGTVLIRYSFDRLDRANGYGAGMPAPAFYHRMWEAGDEADGVPLAILSGIAFEARARRLEGAPSTVAVIAALEQAKRLAMLRGNCQPTRSDLLDAVESCYLEGAALGERHPVAMLAQGVLTGTRIGRVPAAAGLPPIVDDFHAQAKACSLAVEDTESRRLALDVYGNPRARRVSRLLHRLHFLEVPFASRLAGPRFTGRQVGRRLREVWQYGWSPQTESSLIDAAAYGSTIEEAAAQRFTDGVRSSTDDGTARSAEVAAERLALACVLGLHELVARVLRWLNTCAREDPDFESVTAAVHRLALLWQAREPLGATGLAEVPELAAAAFDRAAYLAIDLAATTPENRARAAASALVGLREVLSGGVADWFDASLLWRSAERLSSQTSGEPSILGAAAGMLYSAGRLDEAGLSALLEGRLRAGVGDVGNSRGIAWLGGVLLAAREVAWQSPSVLGALRSVVEADDDAAFVRALPELRLAFSLLTPAETDRVAQVVAETIGAPELRAAVQYGLGDDEVQKNLELSLQLRTVLERDGLGRWLLNDAENRS